MSYEAMEEKVSDKATWLFQFFEYKRVENFKWQHKRYWRAGEEYTPINGICPQIEDDPAVQHATNKTHSGLFGLCFSLHYCKLQNLNLHK